ncbi:AfsR/SARP family transcriptional regulator [Streptomyces sp. NPDC046985]|uniref:AfsR/SARP family transcriptional regulator n=1 Tax=Streptomyces sp. NPDC046985 TaxID=3155377 RepID=UPI0033C1AC3C
MEFRILGSVQAFDERTGVSLVPAGAEQRAPLGALVVEAGCVVSAERLVEELWCERPPAHAAHALQAHVARLRRLPPLPLPGGGEPRRPWPATRPLGYVLRLEDADTDARQFHRLAARGRALAGADPGRSADVLRRALALWRGPALEGGGRGAVCSAEAPLLEESRVLALESLYEACLRAGRAGEITGELERLTASHPLRERFYELLMTALCQCGRQTEALGVYDRARRRLARDLGVQPGPALHGRRETVLRRRDPAAARPPLPPTALPAAAPSPAAAAGPAADEGRGVRPPHAEHAELAGLRRRVERLAREQRDLARRLEALAAAHTAGP